MKQERMIAELREFIIETFEYIFQKVDDIDPWTIE